ncbi:MAG TPA: AfsR/SARP family transcriptional regulator, partial [Ilumatobacteraceae bacterium]|nr:AfsR/SARP family transcriptional regulator [Ilumatobacteraceae bacterium]
MHVQVRVLGPTDVVGDEATIHSASAPKLRQVLAVLAVARGDSVHRATLAHALWPGGEPPSASKTIQTYVWTLRRTLGAHAIVTDGPQYRLGPDVGVDVSEFEAAVAEARDTLSEGRACDAVERFDRALGLWRGPALVDVLDWATGQAEAARLEELRRYAEELRGEALTSCRPDGAAIGELEKLARSEPLRERRWELLVGALTRAGRAAEAVRAVGRAREHLAESGLEVGRELRRLELVALVPSAVEEQPAITPLVDVVSLLPRPGEGRGRLPRSHTRLVGRDRDVAA